MFIRRSVGSSGRFLEVRIALFWLGVIVWLAGVLLESPVMTGAAIVVLLVALALGFVARRADSPAEADAQPDAGERGGV